MYLIHIQGDFKRTCMKTQELVNSSNVTMSQNICMKRSHRGGGSWNEWWAFRVQTPV